LECLLAAAGVAGTAGRLFRTEGPVVKLSCERIDEVEVLVNQIDWRMLGSCHGKRQQEDGSQHGPGNQ